IAGPPAWRAGDVGAVLRADDRRRHRRPCPPAAGNRAAQPKAGAAVSLILVPLFLLIAAGTGAAAQDKAEALALIRAYGCNACHEIEGVPGAEGRTGPPLTELGQQLYVAGVVPNTPEMLRAFIIDPQAIDPRSAMPNLGVTP